MCNITSERATREQNLYSLRIVAYLILIALCRTAIIMMVIVAIEAYGNLQDNGSGICPEDMESLFMEGYSTKFDPQTGNIQRGLGLCLVKDYAENEFGGTLSVRSIVGESTEFEIRIPAEDSEVKAIAAEGIAI